MKKHMMLAPALCLAALSANAQFVTAGGNTTTNDNVGIGTSSPVFKLNLDGTTPAQRTIGIGNMPVVYLPDQALFSFSMAIGNGLRNLTSPANHSNGDLNTAMGWDALLNATGATNNSAFGAGSLRNLLDGQSNVGVGYNAGLNVSTGSYNTAVGHQALLNTTTGGVNIGIGFNAAGSNTTGNSNIGIGFGALGGNQSGSNNIGIGSGTATIGSALNNAVAIGTNARVGKSNGIVLGDSTLATVGIGTAYPAYTLDVRANANPVRFRGLQAGNASTDNIVTADANGVLRVVPASSIGGSSVSAGNGLTVEGSSTVVLGDKCGGGGGAFKEDREINMNNRNLYFNADKEGKLYMGHLSCPSLMTRLEISIKGIPAVNDYDITMPSTSGLRFTDLTALSSPVENKYGGVLSLDEDGDVIWVKDATASPRPAGGVSQEEYDALKTQMDQLNARLATLEGLMKQSGIVLPAQDELFQNVPNPSGNTTRIDYSLGAQGQEAYIMVYDMSGKVMSRVNLQGTAGRSSITVDLSGWAAGTYSYTLFVDGQVRAAKKMQVTR